MKDKDRNEVPCVDRILQANVAGSKLQWDEKVSPPLVKTSVNVNS